jgi:hypothetical protein
VHSICIQTLQLEYCCPAVQFALTPLLGPALLALLVLSLELPIFFFQASGLFGHGFFTLAGGTLCGEFSIPLSRFLFQLLPGLPLSI